LHGDLLHISYSSQQNQVNKLDLYSTLAAKQMLLQGKKPSRFKIVLRPLSSFFSDYFLRAGFLDGLPGFLIAMHSAYYTFLKYTKLRELNHKVTPVPPSKILTAQDMQKYKGGFCL
jgi:hypothetical protein